MLLVSRNDIRDRLQNEALEMAPYLDLATVLDVDSIVLSQCSMDPTVYCRARILEKDENRIRLDCFDYGQHEILEQKNGTWCVPQDNRITFQLFRYPLNLLHFPIIAFGLKLHGVPEKRVAATD